PKAQGPKAQTIHYIVILITPRRVGDGVEGESTRKKTVRFNGYFSTQRRFGGAAEGIEFHDEWPYAIHLLGHIYSNDINSARFLWKKIPAAIKEARPEVVAVWRIGQKLWTRDYVGVHEAIRGFSWSPEVQPFVASFAGKFGA
ncbi:hypothetical protein H5410_010736, partial [Solanum commersonii]